MFGTITIPTLLFITFLGLAFSLGAFSVFAFWKKS